MDDKNLEQFLFLGGNELREFMASCVELHEREANGEIKWIPDEFRLRQVKAACETLKELATQNDPDAQVILEQCELTRESMNLRVVTTSFDITDLDLFKQAIRDANTMIIYPRNDERVCLGLTFTGVAKPYKVE